MSAASLERVWVAWHPLFPREWSPHDRRDGNIVPPRPWRSHVRWPARVDSELSSRWKRIPLCTLERLACRGPRNTDVRFAARAVLGDGLSTDTRPSEPVRKMVRGHSLHGLDCGFAGSQGCATSCEPTQWTRVTRLSSARNSPSALWLVMKARYGCTTIVDTCALLFLQVAAALSRHRKSTAV